VVVNVVLVLVGTSRKFVSDTLKDRGRGPIVEHGGLGLVPDVAREHLYRQSLVQEMRNIVDVARKLGVSRQ